MFRKRGAILILIGYLLFALSAGAQIPGRISTWYDVRVFGAVGDAVTDDSLVLNAVATAAAATGGTIWFPSGNYCWKSGATITGSIPVTLAGAGLNTEINVCAADVNLLTMNNARHALRDIVLRGSQVLTTVKDTITLQSNCVECRIDHVYAVGGRYVLNNAAIDVALSYVNFNQSYGPALIYNGIAAGSVQFWGNRLKVDQIWPVSTPARQAAFPARANTTAYVTGNVVSSGGFLIQATNNGTSAGAPPTLLAYNTNITDGTVIWRLAAPTTFSSIQLDTGSNVVSLHSTDMSGPFTYGLLLSNTLAGTGPQDTIVTDSFFAGILGGIHAAAGAGLNVKGSQIANCITNGCVGVLMDTAWAGDTIITDNLMINNPFGIYAASPNNLTNLVASNNTIFGSSSAAISLQCPLNNVTVTGNQLGSSTTWGANTIGVQVQAGACNHYNITGNITAGAGTGISDAGTGTDKIVDATAWTPFTPTLTCGTATFGSVTARAKTFGKTTWAQIEFTITAIGTCTTPITFTLPNTANAAGAIVGFEDVTANNGVFCKVAAASATATCVKNGLVAFGVNNHVVASGVYENQ